MTDKDSKASSLLYGIDVTLGSHFVLLVVFAVVELHNGTQKNPVAGSSLDGGR